MSPAIKRAATSTSEQIISPTTPPVALKQANQADQEAKLAQVLDKENVVLAVADTPHGTMLAVKSPVVYKYIPTRCYDIQYGPALGQDIRFPFTPSEQELPNWIKAKIAHH